MSKNLNAGSAVKANPTVDDVPDLNQAIHPPAALNHIIII
jgi:hypothetical protein